MNARLRDLGENWTFSESEESKAARMKPQIVQQIMPEQRKTEIDCGFYDEESGSFAGHEIWLPSLDGLTVEGPITSKVVNDVAAKDARFGGGFAMHVLGQKRRRDLTR